MPSEAPIEIIKIAHEKPDIRQRVLDYLAPHETHNLFIIGNLISNFPDSHLYVAQRGSQWAGIAGYYTRPKSLIPFSTDPEIARALAHHVASAQPVIEYMNGIEYAARPAYEALLALGYRPANDPRQVFMELDLPPGADLPVWPSEEAVRPMRKEDAPAVAMLARQIQRPNDHSPLTQEEIARTLHMGRIVVDIEGQIVATAATNGLGLRAFQILSVATDPAHRRHGYARAACAALIRSMQPRGAHSCVLFTDIANTAAQTCYQSLGFRITGDYYVSKFLLEQKHA
ncbi:MAG: GNAT family N-acetyltransferase [Candidatus Sumerlaeota bacterium]|nr:GNAT family N-acetyltransferase [Candidatus Sumerlaeota bacterium]